MKIGVFDSGKGGLSVAQAIQKALPAHEVVFRDDHRNVPYGLRNPQELLGLVKPILQKMVDEGCVLIVVACNTVTTTIIKDLRQYLSVPLVGIEPMVKPAAAMTKNKVIAVCATPTTLASPRYAELKRLYAQDVKVLEPDCSDWSAMIEANLVDYQKIGDRISEVCKAGADVVVLACTHYHWISQEIDAIAQEYQARVIHPEQPVVDQLTRLLKDIK